MSDIEKYLRMLENSNSLRKPIIKTAIESLRIPAGSKGLDAGCGIGLYTPLLAEAAGPSGHVAGLDISEEFLSKAHLVALESGLGDRITFKEGDVCKLPFDQNALDWAFSVDLIGAVNLDPVLILKELKRVVKPGGFVSILIWSSQMLLAGYPALEARLNAALSRNYPLYSASNPESHFMRARGWFQDAGMIEITARTFVRDICPPFSSEMLTGLVDLCQMLWEGVRAEVSGEEWEEYQRLCLPDSSDFIFNVPEYYGFFTYSMFCGSVV